MIKNSGIRNERIYKLNYFAKTEIKIIITNKFLFN
jgi:hypothetical protein